MSIYVNDQITRDNYVSDKIHHNDYYDTKLGKHIDGIWLGKACEALGVERGGVVKDDVWDELQAGRHPVSHEQLTVRRNKTRRGWETNRKTGVLEEVELPNRKGFADLTDSCEKTASVGAIMFGSIELKEAFDRSSAKLFGVAESLIARRNSTRGEDHLIYTGKMAAAKYQHTRNRAHECQVHNHYLIPNATVDPTSGKRFAIDYSELAKAKKFLDALEWDALHHEYLRLGLGVGIDKDTKAPFIIPLKEIAEINSRRSLEIKELIRRVEELAGIELSTNESKSITLVSRGFKVDEFEARWKKNKLELDPIVALDPETSVKARQELLNKFRTMVKECSEKELVETTLEQIEADQWSRLTAAQITQGRECIESIHAVELPDRSMDISDDITFAIEHVFSRKSVVHKYDLYAEVLLHAQGKNVDIANLEKTLATDQRLEFGRGGEVGSTQHHEREVEMFLWVEEGKGKGITIACDGLSQELNESQREGIRKILSCADRHQLLYGNWGVGKTSVLVPVAERYLAAGHRVMVLAPENGARDVLRKDGREKVTDPATSKVFKGAQNLSEFLANPKWRKSLGPGDLVILDEAGMGNLEDVHALKRLSKDQGFTTLVSGDDRQLVPVSAGDSFRLLRTKSSIHVTELTEIVRQDPEALEGRYLKASQLLGEKKVREAIWELYQAGRVKAIKGKERIEYYAACVLESLNGNKPAAISQITHAENDAVSEIVRAKRKELGQLSDERVIAAHRSLHWTPAEKKEIHRLEPGMILQSTRGADKGHAWTVLEVAEGKASVVDGSGTRTTFTAQHAGMFDVCVPRALPMAIGDHMILYSGGKDVVNGEPFIVAAWDKEGNPVKEDGKSVEVRNITYGYAKTVAKVQGVSESKAIFGMDRKSVRAVTRELLSVPVTRGKHDVEIIVESFSELSQIQNKSSHRKGVCEMVIAPERVSETVRDIEAKIEQYRTQAQTEAKAPTVTDEQLEEIDLQKDERVVEEKNKFRVNTKDDRDLEPDLDAINASIAFDNFQATQQNHERGGMER